MKKKIIFTSVVILILAVAGASLYQSFQPLEVSVINIEKSNFEQYHIEEGELKAASSTAVYASESETIVELKVVEGAFVKKGDMLVKLDDSNLQNELAILESEKSTIIAQSVAEKQLIGSSDISIQNESIELAKRDIDALKSTFDNNKTLLESGAVSEDVYNKSEIAYTNSLGRLSVEESKLKQLRIKQNLSSGKKQYYNSQVETLDIQIASMKDRIEKTSILAPNNGTISSFNFKSGDRVTKNTKLFSVSGKDNYEIEIYALAKKIKTLKTGDRVLIEIEVANQMKIIEGSITFISTQASEIVSALGLIEKKVKMLVKPSLVNEGEFILGEKVDVKLITFSKDNVIVISRDFIFPYEEGEALWTIENGTSKIMMIDKIHENSSKIILDAEVVESIDIIIPPYSDELEEGLDVSVK